jgi:hypothetical protein
MFIKAFFLVYIFVLEQKISFSKHLYSRYPLYSQLTKTTAKKPCFSKSGDTAAIGARLENFGFSRNVYPKKNKYFLILSYLRY